MSFKQYNTLAGDDLTKENLINDEDFINDAYNFLYKRNNNTDLTTPEEVYDEFMEHMRYSSVNEVTALRDYEYAQNQDQEGKDEFGRLIDTFDRMPSNLLSVKTMGDYAEGVFTAPSTYAGILTGFTGKAAGMASTQFAKLGLRFII